MREELQQVARDIEKLEELDTMVRAKPGAGGGPRVGPPPKPHAKSDDRKKAVPVDELAFLKSVTEDEKAAPSPKRASGAQFQPSIPGDPPRSTPMSASITPAADLNDDAVVAKTLKCKECGTMNLATEWYCESCGAELAAL